MATADDREVYLRPSPIPEGGNAMTARDMWVCVMPKPQDVTLMTSVIAFTIHPDGTITYPPATGV